MELHGSGQPRGDEISSDRDVDLVILGSLPAKELGQSFDSNPGTLC